MEIIWFAEVPRSSGLAKMIYHSTVNEKRRRGRQKKGWEIDMNEWTGINFAISTRTVRKSYYTPALALPKHMAGILNEKM